MKPISNARCNNLETEQAVHNDVHQATLIPGSDARAVFEHTKTEQDVPFELEEEWTIITHKQSAKRVSNHLLSTVEGVGIPNLIGAS